MEVYQTISFDDTEVLWVGTCAECGAKVEGETPEQVRDLRAGAGREVCHAATEPNPQGCSRYTFGAE